MQILDQLAIPLKQSQVDAACRFWSEGGWTPPEFAQLSQAFPNICEAVSIKAITVNVLYKTNIYAIEKVAVCVERVLSGEHNLGPTLVQELVDEIHSVTNRNCYSFSSKYAHFFVDSSLPILDIYAEWMLGEHLGSLKSTSQKRYERFLADIATLKQVANISCSSAELDAYLWIAGEYRAWNNSPKVKITGALVEAFKSLSQDVNNQPLLATLLGINAEVESKN